MQSSAHKHRDIARSILPSRYRSAAQDLAVTKRRHRRTVRADLRALRRDERHVDDAHADSASDLTRTADAEIGQIRRRRRGADKLNHFERWAVAVTRDLPVEDRLGHLRGTLPAGVIGQHAMSHLRRLPELNPDDPWLQLRKRWSEQWAEAIDQREEDRVVLAGRIRLALERDGGHRAVNLALRSAEGPDDPGRLRLHGRHDVGAVVDALLPSFDKRLLRYGRFLPTHPALTAVRAALDEVGV